MQQTKRRIRAESRHERAVIRRAKIDECTPDLDILRGEEAMSMASQLTRECWSLGGLLWPSYHRSETPYKFVLNK